MGMEEQTGTVERKTDAPRSDAGYWAKPVRTLATHDVPAGAVDLNVSGRRLNSAVGGFGRLWQKTFSVRLEGASVAPQEVIRVWKECFGDFWPSKRKMYLPAGGIAPGEVGIIDDAATIPVAPALKTGILVIYADDESFSFMSPEGHPFAGPLTFSAHEEDGVTVAQVHELTRASDPFWELMLMVPIIGDRMQNGIWRDTLCRLATRFGVSDPDVRSRVVVVDDRRQWANWKNIWNNAGIRSAIWWTAAPVRVFRRRR
jgi:hypothetical protein